MKPYFIYYFDIELGKPSFEKDIKHTYNKPTTN